MGVIPRVFATHRKIVLRAAGPEPGVGQGIAPPRGPRRRARSARLVARQGDAVHEAPMALIVVHRVVLHAAIVPEGDGAGAPAEAAGELRLDLMLVEIGEDRRALLAREPPHAPPVGHVY